MIICIFQLKTHSFSILLVLCWWKQETYHIFLTVRNVYFKLQMKYKLIHLIVLIGKPSKKIAFLADMFTKAFIHPPPSLGLYGHMNSFSFYNYFFLHEKYQKIPSIFSPTKFLLSDRLIVYTKIRKQLLHRKYLLLWNRLYRKLYKISSFIKINSFLIFLLLAEFSILKECLQCLIIKEKFKKFKTRNIKLVMMTTGI